MIHALGWVCLESKTKESPNSEPGGRHKSDSLRCHRSETQVGCRTYRKIVFTSKLMNFQTDRMVLDHGAKPPTAKEAGLDVREEERQS